MSRALVGAGERWNQGVFTRGSLDGRVVNPLALVSPLNDPLKPAIDP